MLMHDKVIQFVNPGTGNVAIVHMPAVIHLPGGGTAKPDPVTEAQKVVPAGVEYQIVDRATVPADRTFRDAWCLDNGAIKGDVEKAKAIALERKRQKRDVLLLEQDKLEQAAVRQGGNVAAIHQRKDELCMCTESIKAYTCTEGTTASLETLVAELLPLEVV